MPESFFLYSSKERLPNYLLLIKQVKHLHRPPCISKLPCLYSNVPVLQTKMLYGYLLTITFLMTVQKIIDCSELPENACQVSIETISHVSNCPNNTEEYIIAASRKGCSKYNNTCKSFEYHCVLNELMTSLVEVCAPSRFILSGKCTEFNKEYQCIRKSYLADCTQFYNPCPEAYNSTQSFLYSQCHRMINTTTEIMPNTTGKDVAVTEQDKQPERVIDIQTISIIAILISITLIIIIIIITFFIFRRKKGMGISYEGREHMSCSPSTGDQGAGSNPGEEPMLLENQTNNTEQTSDEE